jgi:hypothetical protein
MALRPPRSCPTCPRGVVPSECLECPRCGATVVPETDHITTAVEEVSG